MNTTELLAVFRDEVADTVVPYLWSDTLVYAYIDDAQKQFCRETFGIEDARSYKLTITPDTEWYKLSPKITRLLSAADSVTGRDIPILSVEDVKAKCIKFNGSKASKVSALVKGQQKNYLRAWPIPTTAAVIPLSTLRLPADIGAGDDFEIDEQHILNLLLWVKYRAYAKQDVETLDKRKSLDCKTEFLAYCAESKTEQGRLRRTVGVTRFGGIR